MFGSEILEVAIGIIFVYILVAIICSSIREGIEAWVKTRAAFLEQGLRDLLHDRAGEGLAKNIYDHPLISSLFSGEYTRGLEKRPRLIADGKSLPSYIPAKNFAEALMDIAARGPVAADGSNSGADAPVVSLENIRKNISSLGNPSVQRILLNAIDAAEGDINRARLGIQAWYDSGMDRVSGWYKRSTQWIIFWIGMVVAVGLNINTITLADYLYTNDPAREALIAHAETASADTAFLTRTYEQVRQDLDEMSLPIGWTGGWGSPRRGNEPGTDGIWNQVLAPIIGWLMTAFAATMGAPFWFDMLNKVMVIRSTVKPHEKSPEESSEDRQTLSRGTIESLIAAGQAGAINAMADQQARSSKT